MVGEIVIPLVWNLTFTPNTAYPTAFGASKSETSKVPVILAGRRKWVHSLCLSFIGDYKRLGNAGSLKLSEIAAEYSIADGKLLKYEGILEEKEGSIQLSLLS